MAGIAGQRSGGHNAKTIQQHKLEGTHQKVRHAGIASPETPKGKPVWPKALVGDAKAEWSRMIKRLTLTGSLSSVEDMAIFQYCCLFAETEAIAVIQSETAGSIRALEDNLSGLEGAELVQCFQEITKLRQLESRYAVQIRQGRMAIRAYLVEFGLTPASRGRVKLPEPGQSKDPFGEFDDAPGEH